MDPWLREFRRLDSKQNGLPSSAQIRRGKKSHSLKKLDEVELRPSPLLVPGNPPSLAFLPLLRLAFDRKGKQLKEHQ